MREDRTKYPEKVNVFAGIVEEQLTGPSFIEGNVTVISYHHLMVNKIVYVIQVAY